MPNLFQHPYLRITAPLVDLRDTEQVGVYPTQPRKNLDQLASLRAQRSNPVRRVLLWIASLRSQ